MHIASNDVARGVWPIRPALTPAAVATPAPAPWAMERDMTTIMRCPDVTMSASEATMKSNHETSSMGETPAAYSMSEILVQARRFAQS